MAHYFDPHDPYDARMFDSWELDIVFPFLTEGDKKAIAAKNSEKCPLKQGQVNLTFLVKILERRNNQLRRWIQELTTQMPNSYYFIELGKE